MDLLSWSTLLRNSSFESRRGQTTRHPREQFQLYTFKYILTYFLLAFMYTTSLINTGSEQKQQLYEWRNYGFYLLRGEV